MPLPGKKRVLIVDDAVVVRKSLSDAIALDPALEVAGVAANGRIAVTKFPDLKPDVVLLDIEMPEMDGLETVRELRKISATVPIIMFSNLSRHGAAVTLDALALGATDYVAKPSNSDAAVTQQTIARELIPKIRALCRLPDLQTDIGPAPKAAPRPAIPIPTGSAARHPIQVVVIGVSTGGPDALARVIPAFPPDFKVPVLIVQHMPPIFTSLLASRLAASSPLPVRECTSGDPVTPGCAILAPGDFHMVLNREEGVVRLRTHQGPKENFCRPSVDVLFRSAAQVYGGRVLAVVLTGMGQDGLKGCDMLRGMGARIYVQDEATSVVWGMPGFVARAGLADKILPLDQIGVQIVRTASAQSAASAQP